MKIVKQQLDFNSLFRAYRDELIQEVKKELLDTQELRNIVAKVISGLFNTVGLPIQAKPEPPRVQVGKLRRVRLNSGFVKCPMECGVSRNTYKEIGYHIRQCMRGQGRSALYIAARDKLGNLCKCGKRATHLCVVGEWPVGVGVGKTQRAVAVMNKINADGVIEARKLYSSTCSHCSASFARLARKAS